MRQKQRWRRPRRIFATGILALSLAASQSGCYEFLLAVEFSITVQQDPGGHALFIGMPQLIRLLVRELTLQPPFQPDASDPWEVTGPPPFVSVSGNLTPNRSVAATQSSPGAALLLPGAEAPLSGGTFSMTGSGTVAGFPNVSVTFTGTIDLQGNIVGDYKMGANGELPGGQAITYRLTGRIPVPPGTPVLTTSRRLVQFRARAGENPPNQTLSITNSGSGELGWSADIASGLTTEPGGQTAPGGVSLSYVAGVAPSTLQVAASTVNLPPGNYRSHITFSGLPAGAVPNSPQRVDVEVSVGTPVLFENGVVEGAGFAQGRAVAAGGIVSGFGDSIANGSAGAAATPLPQSLGGASIRIDTGSNPPSLMRPSGTAAVTIDVPLFFVSPGQINFQVPWEVAGMNQVTMTARLDNAVSFTRTLPLATYAPGIFTTTQTGQGQGAILIANSDVLVAPVGAIPGRTSRPAVRGTDFITIFCSGLGPVTNRPASGAPASSSPLSETTAPVTVTIGGVNATPTFAGLAPGFVGLYQVNVAVPAAAAPGNAVPVQLTVGGVNSNTATIAVQ